MLTEQNILSINKQMDNHQWICRLTEDNKGYWGDIVTEFIRFTSERAVLYKFLYEEEVKREPV